MLPPMKASSAMYRNFASPEVSATLAVLPGYCRLYLQKPAAFLYMRPHSLLHLLAFTFTCISPRYLDILVCFFIGAFRLLAMAFTHGGTVSKASALVPAGGM